MQRAIHLAKLIENMWDLFRRNADAGVRHAEHHPSSRRGRRDGDTAMRRELEGVGHQVGEHLFETQGVGFDGWEKRRTFPYHVDIRPAPELIDQRSKPHQDSGDGDRADLQSNLATVEAG